MSSTLNPPVARPIMGWTRDELGVLRFHNPIVWSRDAARDHHLVVDPATLARPGQRG